MKNTLIILALLVLSLMSVKAQEVISTSGGTHNNDKGSMSYTIGESLIQSYKTDTANFTEGFHQTTLSVETYVNYPGSSIQVSAYPNPVNEYIRIKVNSEVVDGTKYSLFDINGAILKQENILEKETEISFSNLAPASYFIKIHTSRELIKVFKIIKE